MQPSTAPAPAHDDGPRKSAIVTAKRNRPARCRQ